MACVSLLAVALCLTSCYAAPPSLGSGLTAEELLFDASTPLGEIIARIASFDKTYVRNNVVGDLFAGDDNLYAASAKKGYSSWKHDLIYDRIKQDILYRRQSSS